MVFSWVRKVGAIRPECVLVARFSHVFLIICRRHLCRVGGIISNLKSVTMEEVFMIAAYFYCSEVNFEYAVVCGMACVAFQFCLANPMISIFTKPRPSSRLSSLSPKFFGEDGFGIFMKSSFDAEGFFNNMLTELPFGVK